MRAFTTNSAMSDSFSPYYDELYAYACKRLGPGEEAADVVQDAFLRVFRQGGNRTFARPRPYLYRVLINLIRDRGRRTRRAFRLEASGLLRDAEAPSTERTPAEALVSREAQECLRAAVAALPARCREVLELQRLHGLSHREIAERLSISQSTVEKHVAAALLRLRRDLADLF